MSALRSWAELTPIEGAVPQEWRTRALERSSQIHDSTVVTSKANYTGLEAAGRYFRGQIPEYAFEQVLDEAYAEFFADRPIGASDRHDFIVRFKRRPATVNVKSHRKPESGRGGPCINYRQWQNHKADIYAFCCLDEEATWYRFGGWLGRRDVEGMREACTLETEHGPMIYPDRARSMSSLIDSLGTWGFAYQVERAGADKFTYICEGQHSVEDVFERLNRKFCGDVLNVQRVTTLSRMAGMTVQPGG